MTKITVTLPWPHKYLHPNRRPRSKMAYNRVFQQHKNWAYNVTRAEFDVPCPYLEYTGVFYFSAKFCPPTNRKRDDDNFIAAIKPYSDGIAAALGVDDGQFRFGPAIWGDKHPGGQVIITLEVME